MRISFIHHVLFTPWLWMIFYSFSYLLIWFLICVGSIFIFFFFPFHPNNWYDLGIHSQNADGEDCSSSSFSSTSRASLDQTDCLHQSSSGSGENLILLCNSDSSSSDSPSSYQNAEWKKKIKLTSSVELNSEILNYLWMLYLFQTKSS